MTAPTAHQRLTRAGLSAAFADLVLDQHAHELAEEIRSADYPAHATDGADYAADLIDPEVTP
ncbi:hypothetical protein ABZT03_43150 [Streptomyces sp. NPDC005574]|uniref:hypothetical protein n=1 Tax=Streptomyces sp. NPDC005574 TaxID=3156891 RepID=UPI0033B72F14